METISIIQRTAGGGSCMSRGRKKIGIFGATETGKSTDAEKIALPRNIKFDEPIIILSPNRQIKWEKYGEITLEQLKGMKKGVYRIHTTDFKKFFNIIYNYFQHGVVIAEDATGFLTPQVDTDIFSVIVGLRHPDHDVDILFILHAISRTPMYIIEQLDEIILHKTGENWENIKDRIPFVIREEFKAAFIKVNTDPDPFAKARIIIKKTGKK